ncbi:variable surface protein [Plasmodium gonderi]|uniref:Variable surface protein n=1 Tax=Plasmodium gonderi TaxID=77519 RepID=A0A1Y1JSP7_PLAGO|nr:variable surface protein [Plasmodium gonderi]GAW84177.1 variable surface protein [Plasmodium gonderi]
MLLLNSFYFLYKCKEVRVTNNAGTIESVCKQLTVNVISADAYSDSILSQTKEKDEELFKIGCCLDHYKETSESINKTNLCASLNEWLNAKKKEYLESSKKSDKLTLWDNNIEALWKELQNGDGDKWCSRELNTYEHYNASKRVSTFSLPSLNDILVSVFIPIISTLLVFLIIFNFAKIKRSVHSKVNRKILLRKDVQDAYPLEHNYADFPLDFEDKRINIVYSSK